MAYQGLGARHIHIRLEVPSARDAPPSRKGPDLSEQHRVEFFDPAVEDGLVVVEHEVREFTEQTGAAMPNVVTASAAPSSTAIARQDRDARCISGEASVWSWASQNDRCVSFSDLIGRRKILVPGEVEDDGDDKRHRGPQSRLRPILEEHIEREDPETELEERRNEPIEDIHAGHRVVDRDESAAFGLFTDRFPEPERADPCVTLEGIPCPWPA